IPNVIVNLNGDSRNPDIFRPFQSTIDHLTSIASFEIQTNNDAIGVAGSLSTLRASLFNIHALGNDPTATESEGKMPATRPQDAGAPALQLFECADRDLEIRSIAKE